MESKFMRAICTVLFCSFIFCYLFSYQADVMTIIQYLASGRQTFYDPMSGAVLIALTLKLLQIGTSSLLKLKKRGFGLVHSPSFLTLITTPDLRPTADSVTFGNWLWIAPLLFLVYVLVMFVIKRFEPYEPEPRSYGPFSQTTWTNPLLLFGSFLFTGLFSNSSRYSHQRAKAEALIDKKDYAGALDVVRAMPYTDSVTSMLTVYAVARRGHLADSLSYYPLMGGASTLRSGKVHSWLQPDSVLYKVIHNSANYQLAGLLLGRNLNNFACYLPQYYPANSPRPCHYKEALKTPLLKNRGLRLTAPYKRGSYAAHYYVK